MFNIYITIPMTKTKVEEFNQKKKKDIANQLTITFK